MCVSLLSKPSFLMMKMRAYSRITISNDATHKRVMFVLVTACNREAFGKLESEPATEIDPGPFWWPTCRFEVARRVDNFSGGPEAVLWLDVSYLLMILGGTEKQRWYVSMVGKLRCVVIGTFHEIPSAVS